MKKWCFESTKLAKTKKIQLQDYLIKKINSLELVLLIIIIALYRHYIT